MRRSALIVVAALVLIPMLSGCAGNPQLSGGIGLLSQNVQSGDDLVLRLPQRTGEPAWRVTSFDSSRLQPVGQARRERTGETTWNTIITFVARQEGSTKIEVSNGQRWKTFSVRVVGSL